MAKRKAAAAVVGQHQLFPEALQHQRQLTMSVLVPAETARVIAAEQARRDRASKKNPHKRAKAKACACAANPKRRNPGSTAKRRTSANPVARIELTRAESLRWLNHGSYRLQIIRKAKSLAIKHGGPVQIVDAHGKVRSTLRP